ncbi:MAG: hypothetical protein C4527_00770 [Candidatus Omnitrophota bacterium]|jgi:hypothetical protein|nr:MAG: hypothetical protein C4527_00770 [Candidatus Omnitrophota bacterium]
MNKQISIIYQTIDSFIPFPIYFLLRRFILTLVFTVVLYRLGQYLPYIGDGAYVEQMAEMDWVVLMHSVLTSLMHKLVYTILRPFGWNAWDSVSVSSSIAGALAIQVLFAIRRNPIFLIVNIFSGSFLVFIGEVENYAWVNLFLLSTFWAIERYLQGKAPLWPATVFFFLAALFHFLALFYLPAIFWVMVQRPNFKAYEFVAPFFLFLSLLMGILFCFASEGLDLDSGRLVPLFQIRRKGQFFTFFSWEHWKLLAYFHYNAAFMRFPIEWPLLFFLRKGIDTPFKYFLLYCSFIGLIWTTFWHPDLGPLDWDLFSQMSISLHVLLGILLYEYVHTQIKKCVMV